MGDARRGRPGGRAGADAHGRRADFAQPASRRAWAGSRCRRRPPQRICSSTRPTKNPSACSSASATRPASLAGKSAWRRPRRVPRRRHERRLRRSSWSRSAGRSPACASMLLVGRDSAMLGEAATVTAGVGYDFGPLDTHMSYSLVETEERAAETGLLTLGSSFALSSGIVVKGDLAIADEEDGEGTTAGREPASELLTAADLLAAGRPQPGNPKTGCKRMQRAHGGHFRGDRHWACRLRRNRARAA